MKHTVPVSNWTVTLADLIGTARDGDTIEVHNESMKILARRAHQRMCPDKDLTFSVTPGEPWRIPDIA